MDFYVFEHVRMPINHLFANAVNDIIDIKMSLFFFYCRVKNHLKQDISQFLFEQLDIFVVNCLTDLICLLNEVAANAVMILLAIPHTALIAAQNPHNLQQILKMVLFFIFKIHEI